MATQKKPRKPRKQDHWHLRVSEADDAPLVAYCSIHGLDKSAFIRQAVKEKLEREQSNEDQRSSSDPNATVSA